MRVEPPTGLLGDLLGVGLTDAEDLSLATVDEVFGSGMSAAKSAVLETTSHSSIGPLPSLCCISSPATFSVVDMNHQAAGHSLDPHVRHEDFGKTLRRRLVRPPARKL
jgi:hypothetical protein